MSALVLESSLRGAAVFLIVLALDRFFAPRMQARWRRIWWLLVPVFFLLPWKLPVPLPGWAAHSADRPVGARIVQMLPDAVVAAPAGQPVTAAGILLFVWAAGAAVSLLLLAASTLRTAHCWAGRNFSTDSRLLATLEDCRKSAGVGAPIGLIVCSEIEAPAMLGWLRPRILLPASLAGDENRLRHVLLHELAHFRAMDVPAGWLFAVARCVHWFNPLAYLAQRQWAAFREEAADENALRWSRAGESIAYGETLLSLVRGQSPAVPFGALGIGETFFHIKHRIAMITHHTTRTPKSLLALSMAFALAGLFGLQPIKAESPGDAKTAAVAAMEKWLKIIDEGKYAKSWDEAAASFQKALTSEKWVEALASVRTPLGALESRRLASATYQKDVPLPEGGTLSGEFVIVQFETAFANMKYTVETVTFELQDGSWKASGYFIKPK